jgi:phospholipid transport system substrate-binding protein
MQQLEWSAISQPRFRGLEELSCRDTKINPGNVMYLKGGNGAGHRPSGMMNRREMLRLSFAAACSVPLMAAAAETGGASDAVTEPVAALNEALVAIMKAGRTETFAERYALLTPVVERVFDLPLLLKGTVGSRWAALTADEQTALADAFRRYTIASYVASFNNFGGERFEILPDQRSIGEAVVVATRIVPASGKPARIDYVLHSTSGEGGEAWKVTDILLDGSISQVAVQRSEFRGTLLSNVGVAQLIALLDHKSDSLSHTP